MSQENVELVRRAFEAFNDGDPSFFLDLYDQDIVLRISPPGIEAGSYYGAEAVERYYTQFFEAFGGSYRLEIERLIEVGDSVLTISKATARGRRSGATVRTVSLPWIATMRGGKIIRYRPPRHLQGCPRSPGAVGARRSRRLLSLRDTARAMSQENLQVARAAYDAWNRGDLRSVLDRLHPDVEWEENPEVYPGLDRIYRGHDGFLKRERDAFDVWEWIRVEEQEFIDAGEHVVVFLRLIGKGRHSGIEVEMCVIDVLTFRGGKVTRHRLYADRAEALEAVGLSEQDAHSDKPS